MSLQSQPNLFNHLTGRALPVPRMPSLPPSFVDSTTTDISLFIPPPLFPSTSPGNCHLRCSRTTISPFISFHRFSSLSLTTVRISSLETFQPFQTILAQINSSFPFTFYSQPSTPFSYPFSIPFLHLPALIHPPSPWC